MKNTFIKEFRESKASLIEPTRTRPYVEFICFHCNTTTTMTKASYHEDKPCKECQKRLRGKQNFFKKAADKFGDAFDLTAAEISYYDYDTPVPVTCKHHNHTYLIKPVHFVANSYDNAPHKGGCPKCAEETNKTKNKKPIDQYLQIIEERFPSVSVVSFGTATNNLEKIQLSCPTHGSFEKTLAAVQKANPFIANLCPQCSAEKHAWRSRMARTDIPGTVYFVHFKDVNLYKCGVTYKSVNERLRGHLANIDTIWTLDFSTLSDAYFFEYQFFREYSQYKCTHPDTSFGGYTEFLSQPISKPSERFIEEILCRKESNSEKLPPQLCEDNSERSPSPGTCND